MKANVVFDLSILKNNIERLKQQTHGINFLFPVKCCNNLAVLNIITENGFGFDISNKKEYKIIEKYLCKQFVSVSGPLSYELNNCKYNNLQIFSNNFSTYKEGNGIRINFNANKNFDYSRFGVDYKLIEDDMRKKIKHIHFHNSDHKNSKKCEIIYNEVNEILKYFPNIEILNIGGHLEDLTFEEGIKYLNNIRNVVPNHISIYAELGDFLFKNVGTLYSNVIDIRFDNEIQIVTLNFSKMANQRWAYPTYIRNDNKETVKTIFYGCSCCETDIYLETEAKLLKIGDKIMFKNISPYSYQWNTTFNGTEKMEYVFK